MKRLLILTLLPALSFAGNFVADDKSETVYSHKEKCEENYRKPCFDKGIEDHTVMKLVKEDGVDKLVIDPDKVAAKELRDLEYEQKKQEEEAAAKAKKEKCEEYRLAIGKIDPDQKGDPDKLAETLNLLLPFIKECL